MVTTHDRTVGFSKGKGIVPVSTTALSAFSTAAPSPSTTTRMTRLDLLLEGLAYRARARGAHQSIRPSANQHTDGANGHRSRQRHAQWRNGRGNEVRKQTGSATFREPPDGGGREIGMRVFAIIGNRLHLHVGAGDQRKVVIVNACIAGRAKGGLGLFETIRTVNVADFHGDSEVAVVVLWFFQSHQFGVTTKGRRRARRGEIARFTTDPRRLRRKMSF
jgi:hypothetical protein